LGGKIPQGLILVVRWIIGKHASYACQMIRVFIFLVCLVAGGGASADVYRWVDDDGVIHFSDRPHEGAEIVALPGAQTFSAPAVSRPQPATQPEEAEPETSSSVAAEYTSLRITGPGQDEVLWNIGGVLNVNIALEPRLEAGHSVTLFLDGQAVSQLTGDQRSIQLSDVYRGTHELRAEIHDANGEGVFRSTAVTFTVQQTSVQNTNNPNTPG